jgi:RecA/RadA recombinase
MNEFFAEALHGLGNEYASIAVNGVSGDINGFIDTGCYILNAQLCGDIYGGMASNKALGIGGDSSTGKTYITLSICKYFLEQNPTGGVMYFESESALSKSAIEDRGIDSRRMMIIPVSTIQEFRTQSLDILNRYEKVKAKDRPPMLMVLDSLGQLSTTKEIEDSTAGKETRDMTKAQLIKAAFRVLDLKMGKLNVPMIVTNHIYAVIGAYMPTKDMSGGSGLKYAADQILMVSKSKDKDASKDVVGNILKFKLDKSRVTKEQTTVETRLSFMTGLDRYYGLLDIAVKYGIATKMGKQYKFPQDDKKAFENRIYKYPEKYFTQEILDKINVACKKEFCYGKFDDVAEDEEEDGLDEE